ncbi:conserved protein of unknown function [Thauera humireducens]|uniref:hypothetical protein n=1 Tax=Thauera humireducens TaxID=1134435 RepID=UPI002467A673|nr:hypothetical protein [Thauera humireducens]CAH1747495.1 conserved protein of unknown function [Thauera humireducens]
MSIIDFPARPTTTKREAFAFIAWMRRYARQLNTSIARDEAQARSLRRWIAKNQDNPFHRSRIAKLEQAIADYRPSLDEKFAARRKLGEIVMQFAPAIDQVLTFDERSAALNTNPADLADVPRDAGLAHMISVFGLEDSAKRRRDDAEHGPLQAACHAVMIRFLCEHPEGRAVGDSLFEPGGMFEWLPWYRREKDGQLRKMPPRLRLARECDTPA